MKEILKKLRAYLLVIITIVLFVLISYRLMQIQLVESKNYIQKEATVTEVRQVVDAPRGEITDADGVLLTGNRSCYNIVINKAFFPEDDRERNEIILRVIKILGQEKQSYNDVLPISFSEPFRLDETREDKTTQMREHIGVQIYATPVQCIGAMCDNYGITDDYSSVEKRRIAGVRYTMDMKNFSLSNTYTFAEDVSMATVIKLKEQSLDLAGIEISESAVRNYADGDIIPHLLGTSGVINKEEYQKLSDSGYDMNDIIGKNGIELAMESQLRGIKGERTITLTDGEVTSDVISEEARSGNTIKLTVDSDYQRQIQTILENHIIWLQNQSLPDASGTGADAGAIVVLNAKTGALLAAATAPTYNLNDYIEDYSSVAERSNSPLTNRAVNGLYRPGSTFKTITATAALNAGIITPNTYIDCDGIYKYWDDYQPKCTDHHGTINVITALEKSCNIFFYESGRLAGIDRIERCAKMFGLGGEAGLETGRGIIKGRIASPESYEELDFDWQAGNVVQAAIGQSETAVTPLQMASVAMTIANHGKRYQTYMVDSVLSYDRSTVISKTSPLITQMIPDETGYTFDTVIQGMIQAANFNEYTYPKPREKDYYCPYLLTALPKQAAIKTGTPQMRSSTDTGSAFIGFYPADDPEIAFAGFIEHGEYSKFMVRQLIEAYYDSNFSIESMGGSDAIKTEEHNADIFEEEEENNYHEDDYQGFADEEYYYEETPQTEEEVTAVITEQTVSTPSDDEEIITEYTEYEDYDTDDEPEITEEYTEPEYTEEYVEETEEYDIPEETSPPEDDYYEEDYDDDEPIEYIEINPDYIEYDDG